MEKDEIATVVGLSSLLGFLVFMLMHCFLGNDSSGCISTYEYLDLLGNKGTSNSCYEDTIRGKGLSTGIVGLYCNIDGGKVQVTSYQKIKTDKVC